MFGRDNERVRRTWLRGALGKIPPGSKLLDAGAGQLANKAFCDHLEYTSQDFCQYDGKGDGVGLHMGIWTTDRIDLVCDITEIPVQSASFDAVLCSEVLEHVSNPVNVVAELIRVLRPGGVLILTAPFASLTHFAPFHFSSGLSRYWYEEHLVKGGCSIVEIQANGGWFDHVAQELWRLPSVGKNYSSAALGWLAFFVALPLLIVLRILKRFDRGSVELMTHGWHVVAVKEKGSL